MALNCSFKELRVCLAFTTVTTTHVDIHDKPKAQRLDTADDAATARDMLRPVGSL